MRDVAFDLNRPGQGGISDGIKLCFVIVPQRQMQYQIEFFGDAQLGKLLPCMLRDSADSRRASRLMAGIASGIAFHPGNTITASISTNAPRGSAATPTAARAGYGEVK